MDKAAKLKTLGYLVSILSALLLGIVAFPAASKEPLLLVCLIGGVATAISGIALRWRSLVVEQRGGK